MTITRSKNIQAIWFDRDGQAQITHIVSFSDDATGEKATKQDTTTYIKNDDIGSEPKKVRDVINAVWAILP